ncbi:hypothetical protein E2C01_003546 [Portunus trituberculatus]|uniref:Peptidase A2 domain-containing protein n=1 Tax=Portunus trituberculatus TaxID=210409 RepID=A0A5B7CMG6_PORTR|nr:hypothetical protein [Portunus trituberculatus]
MRAMARLPLVPDGTPCQLDLLWALWLLHLPESIRAAIPNAEEIDENELQEKADHLTDALTVSSRRIHTVPPDIFPPPQDNEDDVAAVQRPPPRAHQSLIRKYDPQPRSKQRPAATKTFFKDQFCFFHAKFGSKARNCQPGCLWPKKQVSRPSCIAAAATGVNTFYFQDLSSGVRFLVDTGATCSLLPAT